MQKVQNFYRRAGVTCQRFPGQGAWGDGGPCQRPGLATSVCFRLCCFVLNNEHVVFFVVFVVLLCWFYRNVSLVRINGFRSMA